MNAPELDACSRCKEPVSLDFKLKHSVEKERELRAGGVAIVPDKPAGAAPLKPAQQFAAHAAASASSAPKPAASSGGFNSRPSGGHGGGGGGGGGGNEAKISKANIHGVVQSRLNHDTASYRGKFENENAAPQKGANVMTLKSLTKNGFISSATRAPAAMAAKAEAPKYASYDDKPLKKWADSGNAVSSGTGLINMLQGAVRGDAMPTLKHTGKTVHAEAPGYQKSH